MSTRHDLLRPYQRELARIAHVRRNLLIAALLTGTALLCAALGYPAACALLLVGSTAIFTLQRGASCPMCGNPFFVRFYRHPTLPGSFARETSLLERRPRCVHCGFQPDECAGRKGRGPSAAAQ